jgi:hypothetical protein
MKELFPCHFEGRGRYPLDTPNKVAEVACKRSFISEKSPLEGKGLNLASYQRAPIADYMIRNSLI